MGVSRNPDSVIQASAGHVFWVSGEGWVIAKELESGMLLHTTDGPLLVSHVEAGEPVETYNLIVDDFHTYFAGERKVLCHDNTEQTASQTTYPAHNAGRYWLTQVRPIRLAAYPPHSLALLRLQSPPP